MQTDSLQNKDLQVKIKNIGVAMSRFLLAIVLGLSACSSSKLSELSASTPIIVSSEPTAESETVVTLKQNSAEPMPAAVEPIETTPVNWMATMYPIAILVFAGSLILFYFQRKIRVNPEDYP